MVQICFKWNGREISLDMGEHDTVRHSVSMVSFIRMGASYR